MMRLPRQMLILTAAAALLWIFHLYARTLPDAALLAVWLIGAALMALGLLRRRRMRRHSFLVAYVAPDSALRGWLRGGLLMALGQMLLALLLMALLLPGLVRSTESDLWLALFVAAPLLAVLHELMQRAFAGHISPDYLPEFSLRLCLPLIGLPLLAWLVWQSLQTSHMDFQGVSLERAVWHLAGQEQARSEVLLAVLQFAAASEALRLWLAQQLLPALQLPLYQGLAWSLVFVREVLFVWSYLLLLQGVLLGVMANDRYRYT